MQNTFMWAVLIAFGVLLIIAGVQGSAGLLLGVAFVPGDLNIDQGSLAPSAKAF